jgi:sorbitol-specific phosphotransferase system component IIC
MEQQLSSMMPWLIPVIIVIVVWDSVWKLIAMWKSARNDQLVWFICIAVINTIGILPIIYLLLYKRRVNVREIA